MRRQVQHLIPPQLDAMIELYLSWLPGAYREGRLEDALHYVRELKYLLDLRKARVGDQESVPYLAEWDR